MSTNDKATKPSVLGGSLTFVLPVLLLLLARNVRADDGYFSPTDDRVRLSLGAMHVSTATTVRADSSAGVTGTVINGEDQFGLDKSDFAPKIEASLRVATRQRLTFDYFSLDRTGNAVVGANPIVFRDVIFLPNDPLQTTFSLRTLGIAYEYSFWHSEKLEIAATLGVHSTDISALAKVQTETTHIIQTEDHAGVVPTVGLHATWVASRRFYFDGRAQYLTAHIDNVGGSIGLYEFDGLYRFRPNVSFGVGYNDITVHLTSSKTTNSGLFDFSTKGPEMFVRVAF
jgi:hypothetical protein